MNSVFDPESGAEAGVNWDPLPPWWRAQDTPVYSGGRGLPWADPGDSGVAWGWGFRARGLRTGVSCLTFF